MKKSSLDDVKKELRKKEAANAIELTVVTPEILLANGFIEYKHKHTFKAVGDNWVCLCGEKKHADDI
jgi:phosphoribosylamine-glycine ligase